MEQPHWELSLERIKPGCFSDSPERPPTSCEHMCLESRVGNVSLQVTGDYQNWSTEIKRVRIDRTWGTSDWGAWGDPIFRMLLSHYIPELYHLCDVHRVGCSYSVMRVGDMWDFLGLDFWLLTLNMLLCSDSCVVRSWHQGGPHSHCILGTWIKHVGPFQTPVGWLSTQRKQNSPLFVFLPICLASW